MTGRLQAWVGAWTLTALVCADAHAAEPLDVIIFSGGTTAADGERGVESFKRLQPALEGVAMPQGHPRVVESRTLPGLKAGFTVVLLGMCPRDVSPSVLAAFKAVYPGTYLRTLDAGVGQAACPALSGPAPVPLLGTAAGKGGTLTAVETVQPEKDDRGEDVSSSRVHVVRVDKAGTVLDVVSVDGRSRDASGDGPAGREYQSCNVDAKPMGGAWMVTRTCRDERTGCNPGEKAIPRAWTETVRVAVVGNGLKAEEPQRVFTAREPCVAGVGQGD